MSSRRRSMTSPQPAPSRQTAEAVVEGPPLKWAGGKRWQLPHLAPFWRQASGARLVEPFCGGLAVTLGLMPKRALLNDVNPHLINFYRHLQSGLTRRVDMADNREL